MKFILIFAIILLYDLETVQLDCPQSYHNCVENVLLKCIPNEWLCDHNKDCDDGSDEANCPIVRCDSDQYRCKNSDICIKKSQVCDGFKDCVDNSDEFDCKPKMCNMITEYDCLNDIKTECIALENVCLGTINCSNHRNTKENCSKDMCMETDSKHRCSHKCINKYSSFACDCPAGMKLDNDNLTCKKINVCFETPEICDQECTLTKEGHSCSCYEGYTSVGKTCELINTDAAAYLLYLSFDGVNALTLFNNNPLYLQRSRKLIQTFDKLVTFDTKIKGKDMDIYLSHVDKEAVLSLSRIKDWQNVITTNEFENQNKIDSKDFIWPTSFYSIAADGVRDLVFWTNTKIPMISVFNSSSQDKRDINITDCYNPISLVVDPIKTKLFWIDLGQGTVGPHIMMANMDGSDKRTLVKTGLRRPISLALDIENQNLYWNDIGPGTIQYLNLNAFARGENKVNTLFETQDYLPYSLALYKDRIYWSDLHQNRIYSVHKIYGNGLRTVVEQVRSKAIRIVSSIANMELKRNGNGQTYGSICSGSHNPCQHSCLPSSSKDLTTCFESPHNKKANASSWWFIIIPIALIFFAGVCIIKYRSFKSRHPLTNSPRNVHVYDHVKFWDDGKEDIADDSQVVNVPDMVPILQTV